MTYHNIRSEQFFVRVLNEENMAKLQASLDKETTEDLIANIRSGGADWANPVFGGSARSWHNIVAKELHKRGINQYDTVFGPVQVILFSF